VRQALVAMAFILALGCSDSDNPDLTGAAPDCSVTSMGQDRFGYLICTDDQAQVVECPDYCPGVAPACVTRCTDGHVSNGPDWVCPCSGDSCFRVVQNQVRLCPGCGDGVIEGAEQCEGAENQVPDLAGQDCVSMGCTGGTLACSFTCTFDLTSCTGCP